MDTCNNIHALTKIMDQLEPLFLSKKPHGLYTYPFFRMFYIKMGVSSAGTANNSIFEDPIQVSNYIYPSPDRNKVLSFFEKDARLAIIKTRYFQKRTDLKNSSYQILRKYFGVLYPILVLKRYLLVNIFNEEIANQEYDQIMEIFPGWLLEYSHTLSSKQDLLMRKTWDNLTPVLREITQKTFTDQIPDQDVIHETRYTLENLL